MRTCVHNLRFSGTSRKFSSWIFEKVLNLRYENRRCNIDVPSRGDMADGAGNGNASMNGTAPKNEVAQSGDAEAGHSTEPPDNELIDFDAF